MHVRRELWNLAPRYFTLLKLPQLALHAGHLRIGLPLVASHTMGGMGGTASVIAVVELAAKVASLCLE